MLKTGLCGILLHLSCPGAGVEKSSTRRCEPTTFPTGISHGHWTRGTLTISLADLHFGFVIKHSQEHGHDLVISCLWGATRTSYCQISELFPAEKHPSAHLTPPLRGIFSTHTRLSLRNAVSFELETNIMKFCKSCLIKCFLRFRGSHSVIFGFTVTTTLPFRTIASRLLAPRVGILAFNLQGILL